MKSSARQLPAGEDERVLQVNVFLNGSTDAEGKPVYQYTIKDPQERDVTAEEDLRPEEIREIKRLIKRMRDAQFAGPAAELENRPPPAQRRSEHEVPVSRKVLTTHDSRMSYNPSETPDDRRPLRPPTAPDRRDKLPDLPPARPKDLRDRADSEAAGHSSSL